MADKNQNGAGPAKVFTEGEYRANAKSVVAHAVATGSAIVVRADGTARVVISIPPADPSATKRWSSAGPLPTRLTTSSGRVGCPHHPP
jgi:hypothetical protein